MNENTETLIIDLEPELKEAFKNKVKEDDRTMAQAVRMLIRRYVDGEISGRRVDGE